MLSLTLRLALMSLLVSTAVAAPQQKQSYFSFPPTPQGELLVSKPEISWSIWGQNNLKVSSVSMKLDGLEIPAIYDRKSRTVSAKLPDKLEVGRHLAVCVVKFDSGHEAEESWSFVVKPGAVSELPKPKVTQFQVLNRVNQLRQLHGLQNVRQNDALNAAAQAHANYMSRNNTAGHKERVGIGGFTGATPGKRAQTFGFYGRNSEAVASSQLGPVQSVSRLFDAPYHRVMFLQPGSPAFGSGFVTGSSCLKFGGKPAEGVIASPPVNGRKVPLSWDGVETPDPLRNTRVYGEVGYPVVLAAFGEKEDSLRLISGEMFLRGNKVELIKLHPGNDGKLDHAIVLIPRRPLNVNSEYTVNIVYLLDGKRHKKQWSFTTGR